MTKTVNSKKKEYKTPTAAQFKRMNRMDKRVAIARDVLEQIKVGRYNATRGTYFRFTKQSKDEWRRELYVPLKGKQTPVDGSTRNAQPFLTDPKVDMLCHVCAKGAAVCSLTRIVNKRTFKDLSSSDPEIIKIFGIHMWAEMEAMFEGEFLADCLFGPSREALLGDSNYYDVNLDDLDIPKARLKHLKQQEKFRLKNRYSRNETELEDIMKNIIRNKGRLKTQHGETIV